MAKKNVDYQKLYNDRLRKLKESVVDSGIYTELALRNIANDKIQALTDKMSDIVGKPVWEDFSFRTGKILGVLRFIAQNPKHRQQLLAATGLTQDYIDLYFQTCGNLPYVTSDNKVNEGRPMDVKSAKAFISVVAAKLGLVVNDDDLSDISQERWDRLYENALIRAKETVAFNQQNQLEVRYEE